MNTPTNLKPASDLTPRELIDRMREAANELVRRLGHDEACLALVGIGSMDELEKIVNEYERVVTR